MLDEAEDEDDAPPPALPAAPPPQPNWNTFPDSSAPITDLSFLDSSDLLPDQSAFIPNDNEGRRPVLREADLTDAARKKIDILRRRSEFLGVELEQLEEYKNLQAGKTPSPQRHNHMTHFLYN